MFRLLVLVISVLSVNCAEKAPRITQNDGSHIPMVGLGTFGTRQETYQAVRDAIDAGYRHIDTSLDYGSEKDIGRAIKDLVKEGKIKREELYIVSKLEGDYHARAKVPVGIKESLTNLGLEYLDLYLIHNPSSPIDVVETWHGMEDVHKSGLAKSIGVSNFDENSLDRILKNSTIKPVTDQVSCNPYWNQKRLLEYLNKNNITLTAYSPLGAGNVDNLLKDAKLVAIGHAHNVTSAQVALRYQIQRNVIVIPKSVTKKYIIENIDLFGFKLTDDEMHQIDALTK